MIDTRATSAITALLRSRLDQGLNRAVPGTQVSTRPPDKVRVASGHQLNLFLYRLEPHAAWRNALLSAEHHAGGARCVMALRLYYLLSIHGADDDAGPTAHWLLVEGMRILEQQPILSNDELAAALAGAHFAPPARHVEVTPHVLSSEEMSKLWGMFHVPYRLSVAYEVAVVLADDGQGERAGD